MASKYQKTQRMKAVNLIKEGNVFYGSQAGNNFRGKPRDFVGFSR